MLNCQLCQLHHNSLQHKLSTASMLQSSANHVTLNQRMVGCEQHQRKCLFVIPSVIKYRTQTVSENAKFCNQLNSSNNIQDESFMCCCAKKWKPSPVWNWFGLVTIYQLEQRSPHNVKCTEHKDPCFHLYSLFSYIFLY